MITQVDTFYIYDPYANAYAQQRPLGIIWGRPKSEATKFREPMAFALIKSLKLRSCLLEYSGTINIEQYELR